MFLGDYIFSWVFCISHNFCLSRGERCEDLDNLVLPGRLLNPSWRDCLRGWQLKSLLQPRDFLWWRTVCRQSAVLVWGTPVVPVCAQQGLLTGTGWGPENCGALLV